MGSTGRTVAFRMTRTVKFQDVDAAGILFFARAFEYFNDAYLAALEAGGIDVPRVLRESSWASPLGHAEASFKAPLRFGDKIAVEIEKAEVGRTSLTLSLRVCSELDPTHVYFTGKMVHVFLDAARKPTSVPDDVKRALGIEGAG